MARLTVRGGGVSGSHPTPVWSFVPSFPFVNNPKYVNLWKEEEEGGLSLTTYDIWRQMHFHLFSLRQNINYDWELIYTYFELKRGEGRVFLAGHYFKVIRVTLLLLFPSMWHWLGGRGLQAVHTGTCRFFIFSLSQNEWLFCWVSNFNDMDLFSEIVDPPPFTALHNIRIYCALRYICVHGIHNMWSRHILMMTGLYWRYIAYLASQPH